MLDAATAGLDERVRIVTRFPFRKDSSFLFRASENRSETGTNIPERKFIEIYVYPGPNKRIFVLSKAYSARSI